MRKENFQRFGFEFRKGRKVFHLSAGSGKTLCGRGFYNLNMFPDEVRLCKTCVKCVRITRVSGRTVAIFKNGRVMGMLEGKREKRNVSNDAPGLIESDCSDCEDQGITAMPECCVHPMCALKGKPLENRNGMMICPTCGDSYGKR